jgi:hypothetical protein
MKLPNSGDFMTADVWRIIVSEEELMNVLRLVCFSSVWLFFSFVSDIAQAGDSTSLSLVQRQAVADSAVTIELRQSSEQAEFVVVGLSNTGDWKKFDPETIRRRFSIRVASSKNQDSVPPLLGDYLFHSDELRFISRFPLSPELRYVAMLSLDANQKPFEILFSPRQKEPSQSNAKVSAVFPTSDVLPENLLKFYIHFSEPMSRGEAYDRIHLMTGNKEVEAPFLELGEELWDADQMRFTLFVHPGRIKRGVKPREDRGLPMTSGNEYDLVIDREWKTADRRILDSKFVKRFRIVEADDQQPDPMLWKIETPKRQTLDPVSLTFNEPLDSAMLNRVLNVRDSFGNRVAGAISVVNREKTWRFLPELAWNKGVYSIEVATILEDLCGNSLARPFERKLQKSNTDALSSDESQPPPIVAIEFSID